MNYYSRHIGDYLKDTAHLSLLEHGVFSRLLDVYYTKEGPIADAEAARLIGARTKEERAALKVVLSEFFVSDGESWLQRRCEAEIARAKDKQRKASASASARWDKTNTHSERTTDAMRTHSEGNAPNNHTPIANSQYQENTHTATPTDAGRVCLLMREIGLAAVNPGHPTLIALIDAGATDAEFIGAATSAVAGGKGFAYALGTLKRQREEAATLALHKGAMPATDSPFMRDRKAQASAWMGTAAPNVIKVRG
jgi:uncharacterized protein YdaU (DUF1376 family)